MKKVLVVLFMVLLVCTLILAGCAQQTPAPSSKSAPPSSSAPSTAAPTSKPAQPTTSTSSPAAGAAAPIKLKWTHLAPPQDMFNQEVFIPWVQMIKERTTAIGKPVEITIYPGETLVKGPDTYDSILSGVAEMGSNWGPQHFPGRMPMLEGLNLPLLFASTASASMTAQELFDTRPEIQKELSEAKILAFHPPAPYQITCRSKQVKTLEDFKGLKSMVRGGTDSDMMKALGAVPVQVTMPETYMALERGTVDMAALSWQGCFSFKWHEVTKYRTDLPIGLNTSLLIIAMNKNIWNGLPKDVQQIFTELSGPYLSKMAGQVSDKAQAKYTQMIKDYDAKAGNPPFYALPNDEYLKWKQAVNPLYEKWAADNEAKGRPGKSMLADIQKLADKNNKEYPK